MAVLWPCGHELDAIPVMRFVVTLVDLHYVILVM